MAGLGPSPMGETRIARVRRWAFEWVRDFAVVLSGLGVLALAYHLYRTNSGASSLRAAKTYRDEVCACKDVKCVRSAMRRYADDAARLDAPGSTENAEALFHMNMMASACISRVTDPDDDDDSDNRDEPRATRPHAKSSMLEAIEEYRERACACTSVDCAAHAANDYVERMRDAGSANPDETEAISEATTAAAECYTKLAMAAIPRPP